MSDEFAPKLAEIDWLLTSTTKIRHMGSVFSSLLALFN